MNIVDAMCINVCADFTSPPHEHSHGHDHGHHHGHTHAHHSTHTSSATNETKTLSKYGNRYRLGSFDVEHEHNI